MLNDQIGELFTDTFLGFFRRCADMRRQRYLWVSKQLFTRRRLIIKNIHSCKSHLTAIQCGDEGQLVDHATARGVDDTHARLYQSQLSFPDDRLLRIWNMKRNEISLLEQFIQLYLLDGNVNDDTSGK